MILDPKHQDIIQNDGRAPPEDRKLVIFTGESFVAHRHLHDLLPYLKQRGVEPVIFLTPSSDLPKANTPSLKKFFFYEEGIFTDVIYPALDGDKSGKPSLMPTFNQMAKAYDFSATPVTTVNDEAVQDALVDPATIGVVSIYQDMIFKIPFINSVKQQGLFFWNLHPALLPEHRGVLVAFWSQATGQTRHGYTLHEIEPGIDTGRIISKKESFLKPGKSAVENYFHFTNMGSSLLKNALEEYLNSGTISYMPLHDTRSEYYSFPTEEDVARARRKGGRLWGTPDEMHDLYIAYFGRRELLSPLIKAAIAEMEKTGVPIQHGTNPDLGRSTHSL